MPVAGRDRSRSWLVALLLAFALLAGFEWRRAAALEAHVAELAASLATAQAEVAARRAQLGTIRASVEDLSQRLAALAQVAAEEPTAPSVPPAGTHPAQ